MQPKGVSPRCCVSFDAVSFSAYYIEYIIPCQNFAYGCPANTDQTCSSTSLALFLPSQALLVPLENRTTLARAWADLPHFPLSKPLPCGDNCGVSINWHLFTNYRGGWSARITILNWDDFACRLVYNIRIRESSSWLRSSVLLNGSALNGVNNTIFMHGLPGLNYLVAEVYGADPQKNLRVPGNRQSVISFTKKTTPGINIPGGDGFPSKVYFNGEECSLPKTLPTSSSYRLDPSVTLSFVLVFFAFKVCVAIAKGMNARIRLHRVLIY